MVLYTPLVESDIFPATYDIERQFISYEGRTLQVTQLDGGEYQIEQLLSTDPKDFLNHQFNPGNIISL